MCRYEYVRSGDSFLQRNFGVATLEEQHDLLKAAVEMAFYLSSPEGDEHMKSGSNLLIDNEGNLKLTDFGLARTYSSDHKGNLTNRVITLCRPPELLLRATKYGLTVDMWLVGCIFAELLFGKPILMGKNEVR
ncbi:cyclin-dependent kinase C-1-like protein [Tanacetum coccineum]